MKKQLLVREFPFGLWLAAFILLAVGFYFYSSHTDQPLFLIIAVGVSLLILLFASILTVTADKDQGTLKIARFAPLRRSTRVLNIDEIRAIQVEQDISSDSDGSRSVTYRVVAVMEDGEVIPFRSGFSSGEASKEKMAKRLREFLEIDGTGAAANGAAPFGAAPYGALSSVAQMAQEDFQREQESITGPNEVTRETDGVSWRLETLAFGGVPITRWFSGDYCWTNHFLYLVQRPETQKPGRQRGLAGTFNTFFLQQSMRFYGFSARDAAGLDVGQPLAPLDPSLDPHFSAYTSNPTAARQILNPEVTAALAAWTEVYPLTHGSSNQLALLISANGVTLASPGLSNSQYLEKLAYLGAKIVKTQKQVEQAH